ncbi:MAG: hypothetical protein ACXVY3_03120 [Gaiellaceae bacterium]
MSTEYVTLVRDCVAAWTNGDPADLGDLQMFAPEVVYEDNILPDHHGETYRGRTRKAWARARFQEGKVVFWKSYRQAQCRTDHQRPPHRKTLSRRHADRQLGPS